MDYDSLLGTFKIRHDIVEKITKFLNKKASRILRQRRDILIDAITQLYSIKKACETRGDNPKQVVAHLTRHLPSILFLEDDINYEYYPEMVIALRRFYAKEFIPSLKLLTMAFLIRAIKEENNSISCDGEKYSLFWFRNITDAIHFLYDLKIAITRTQGSILKVEVPLFMFSIILDGEDYDVEYIKTLLMMTNKAIVFRVLENKTTVFLPDTCKLTNVISQLSQIISTETAPYTPNKQLINQAKKYIRLFIIKRNIQAWRLGTLVFDLINIETAFQNFLNQIGLSIDTSKPPLKNPRRFLPIILLIYSALLELQQTPIRLPSEKPQIRKEEKPKKEEQIQYARPKRIIYSPGKTTLLNFQRYIRKIILNYLLSSPLQVENIEDAIIIKNILSLIAHKQKFLYPTLISNENKYFLYAIDSVLDAKFCLIETYLEAEKTFSWVIASKDVYVLSTPWLTTFAIIIADNLDTLKRRLQKILSTYAKPWPDYYYSITLENCDFICWSPKAHFRDVLVALYNQSWICQNNIIELQNASTNKLQFLKTSPNKFIVDLIVQELESIEIHRTTLNFEQIPTLLEQFGKNKVFLSDFEFKLISKEKYQKILGPNK